MLTRAQDINRIQRSGIVPYREVDKDEMIGYSVDNIQALWGPRYMEDRNAGSTILPEY